MYSIKKIWSMISDVDVLRTHIIPIRKEIFLNEGEIIKSGTPISLTYWNYMRYISKKYDSILVLKDMGDWAGMYDSDGHIIMMKKKFPYGRTWFIKTFFHELAHRIQHTIVCSVSDRDILTRSFNEIYLYERAAERLAYFIWERYLGHKFPIHHLLFNSYVGKKGKNMLMEYREGHEKLTILCK